MSVRGSRKDNYVGCRMVSTSELESECEFPKISAEEQLSDECPNSMHLAVIATRFIKQIGAESASENRIRWLCGIRALVARLPVRLPWFVDLFSS